MFEIQLGILFSEQGVLTTSVVAIFVAVVVIILTMTVVINALVCGVCAAMAVIHSLDMEAIA